MASSHGGGPEASGDTPCRRSLAGWLLSHERWIFFALVGVQILPLCIFRYFPSQDGPAHLENASIILGYDEPDRGLWREYYEINPRPEPTWPGHLLLAGLLAIFPLLVAEKVLLAGYLILFALSIRYALGAVDARGRVAAFLLLPFATSHVYHMGFYSFCYSLPAMFLALGYWMRHRTRLKPRHGICMALLLGLTFVAHIASLMIVGFLLGVYEVGTLLVESGARSPRCRGWVPLRWLALASSPAVACASIWLSQSGLALTEGSLWQGYFANMAANLLHLALITPLITFSALELFVSGGLTVLMIYILVIGAAQRRDKPPTPRRDVLWVIFPASVALCLLVPDQLAGGSMISSRLRLVPFFALVLWLGGQRLGGHLRRLIVLGGGMLVLCSVALHASSYARLNRQLADYLTCADFIDDGSTVLPLTLEPHRRTQGCQPLALRTAPFRHAASYLAAERNVVELANYEADMGYFPIRFRLAKNPYEHLGAIEGRPLEVDLDGYDRAGGDGRVDYVLVWGADVVASDDERFGVLAAQLSTSFVLVHESPLGLARLYKRK